jgi:ribosomal-protein-alanine N-acetyltransferase
MYGPRLAGQQVTLAPPVPEHSDDYVRWFTDPLVTRFLNLRNPPSRDQHEIFLREQGLAANAVLWSILVGDRHIGHTLIKDIDWRNRHAGTGLVIGERECWGRGFAGEAMRLRTAYAFRELGLEKLMSTAYGPNEASRRALQRAGYREVGWLRRHVYLEGAFIDVWSGEVLREEWAQAAPPAPPAPNSDG